MDCLASVLPRLKESSAMLGTSAAVLFEKSMQLAALQQELRLASAGGRPVPGGLEYDSSALVCSLDLVGVGLFVRGPIVPLSPPYACAAPITCARGGRFFPSTLPACAAPIICVWFAHPSKIVPAAAAAAAAAQMSGLAEALGASMEALVAGSPLAQLIAQCCRDDAAEVRQSAFALVGDMARSSPAVLHPVLADVVGVALQILDPKLITQVGDGDWGSQ